MTSMKINHFSQVLHMNMDCRLLLPDRLEKGERLRVMWLCHGGNGDENEWLYHSTVAGLVNEQRMAFVLVNANDSCFVDMPNGMNYGSYIGEELYALLHRMFLCLSDKREDNFVSGLSNGGYGCFWLGLTFPEHFGAIGAFSAGDKADSQPKPHKPGSMKPEVRMFGAENIHGTRFSIKQLARELAAADRPKPCVYHACGSLDPWLDMNRLVRDCFAELDCPAYRYEYHQAEGMGHEWSFWDAEIRNFLKYLEKTVR